MNTHQFIYVQLPFVMMRLYSRSFYVRPVQKERLAKFNEKWNLSVTVTWLQHACLHASD